MTCEFNNEECEGCLIKYCPDQVEAIKLNHKILKDAVNTANENLKNAEERLLKYIKEYADVLT